MDEVMQREVVECKYPIKQYDDVFKNKNLNIIDTININQEGGSFLFKESLLKHLPTLLTMLCSLVKFDSSIKHAKFLSPACDVVMILITTIAYHSRRENGHRLCYKSCTCITDPKHVPKKLSKIMVLIVKYDNEDKLAFHWSFNVPASMKSAVHNAKSCLNFDGHLHCCDCACKMSNNYNNGIHMKGENMVCMHTCPTY